jgi:acetolactate synthase small subunit
MRKFVIAVLVDNKPGVLMRVTSMFTRRGFNIDALTVSAIEDPDYSRITITITGDENTKNQFVSQMKKLYNVKKVQVLDDDVTVKRELMLIKVKNSPETRADIIQSIKLQTPEKLIAFCQGLQSGSAIDSFVVPEPWAMPGYDSEVIMAAGAFTNGSSIELSADAPLREPFAVWLQGGLNFHSAKIGVMLGAERVQKVEN